MLWVRNSEIQDFLKNRAGWYYRWVEGLVPKQQAKPLAFGTAFHKFIEVLYTSQSFDKAFEIGKMELNELTKDVGGVEWDDLLNLYQHVTSNYSRQYNHEDSNWNVIATELSFAIPLDDEIGFTGTIDLIIRDKTDGKVWFLDHKTSSSIEKYDRISDIDTQITKYWWALQQLAQGKGWIMRDDGTWVDVKDTILDFRLTEPFGFIYNIILKDYPVPPKVLKDGLLSKAKNQKTTYDLYMNELIKNGLEPPKDPFHEGFHIIPHDSPYHEILTYLVENPKEYFKRIRVFRNQTEIDNTMNEFYNICKEIKKVREGEAPVYRTVNFDTIHDPYLPLYQAEIDGSDVEYLKETLYTKEDVNHEFPNR